MGSKRRNDNNQVSKEDYEAQQLRDEMEGGDENQVQSGFTRASAEVMKTRRLARVSNRNRFKRSAGSGTGSGAAGVRPSVGVPGASGNNGAVPNVFTPKAGSSGGGGAPNNPFANTILSTTNNNHQEEETKPNPFANVSLASSSKAAFSFNANTNAAKSSTSNDDDTGNNGTTTQPTKRTKTSSSADTASNSTLLFSFAPKESTSTSKINTTSKPQQKHTTKNQHNNSKNEVVPLSEGTLLNLKMLRMAQLEGKANPLSDWTEPWLKIYLQKAKALKEKEEKELKEKNEKKEKTTVTTFMTQSSTTKSAPSSSGSSFGTSTSSTTTAAAVASTAPKFNFSVPASTTGTSTTASTITTKPATTTMTNTEDIEKIAKVVNEDDDELYECKAKYRKFIESENNWKGFAPGTLRLTKSKTTQKAQMVIRNDSGKVQFNVRVFKGMKFVEQKAKDKGHLLFGAIQDEAVGPEKFRLTVKLDDFDGLSQSLKSISG